MAKKTTKAAPTFNVLAQQAGKAFATAATAEGSFKATALQLWAAARAEFGADLPLAAFHSPTANDKARKAATNAHVAFYTALSDGIAAGMFTERALAVIRDESASGSASIGQRGLSKTQAKQQITAALARAKSYVIKDHEAQAKAGSDPDKAALAAYKAATTGEGPWARAPRTSKAESAADTAPTALPVETLAGAHAALRVIHDAAQDADEWNCDVPALCALLANALAVMERPVTAARRAPRKRS